MNKKLLSIAVGAALAAASGMAAADVAWYGHANVALENVDNDGADSHLNAATTDGELDLISAGRGARFGFNADTEVNGVKVGYWHEMHMNTTDGPANSMMSGHRDNFLTIGGDFGTVAIGYGATPSKVIGAGKIDGLFADTLGDLNGHLIRQPVGSQIQYRNSFDAVNFAIAWGPSNGGEDTGFIDGRVGFGVGPLAIDIGHRANQESIVNAGGPGTSHVFESLTNAAVAYTMDNIKVIAGYQMVGSDGDAAGDAGDSSAWMIGASFGLGDSGTIKAQYTTSDHDDDAINQTGHGTMTTLGWSGKLNSAVGLDVYWSSWDGDDDLNDVEGSGYGVKLSYIFR